MQGRNTVPRRQSTGTAIKIIGVCLLLAACAQQPTATGPRFGGAASDEPRAATIARDVVEAGGSAADGAVAGFFALTATFPAAASLAGGGVCVVHRPDPQQSEVLDFPVRAPARGGSIGVPAATVAMAALHARYGRLRWEQVVTPAEQLARFGHPASRAAVLTIRATSVGLLEIAPRIFGGPGGQALAEGETLQNPALGATLGRIRTYGVQDLHRGPLARSFADDIREAGGSVDETDLRAVVPSWTQPLAIDFANSKLLVPDNMAGQVFAGLWGDLVREPTLWRQVRLDRSGFLDAIGAANQRMGKSPPFGSDNAVGMVVADGSGMVVACGFTMGNPFGAVKYGRATGIMLANTPDPGLDEQALLLPLVGASPNIKQVFLGAVATGGAFAPAAMFETVATVVAGDKRAPEALARPRTFWAGDKSFVLHENGVDPAILASARQKNLEAVPMQAIGLVDILHCTEALPRVPSSCGFRSDPRGHGIGAGGGF